MLRRLGVKKIRRYGIAFREKACRVAGNEEWKDKNLNQKRKKKAGGLPEILCLLLILGFAAMSLYCTRYITYQADDFSYMMSNQAMQEQNPTLSYLHVELSAAWKLYRSWQGNWFTDVLISLLYGLHVYGIGAFRIACFLCDLFFLASLLYLIYEVSCFLQVQNRRRGWLILSVILIWGGLNTVSPAEEWYWIDVVFSYTVPMTCGFCGIGLYLRSVRENRRAFLVTSAVLGFLGCGGPLNGTAWFCAMYLLIAFLQFLEDRKVELRHWLPFWCALVGALLNAMAPGNFIRHDAETNGSGYQLLYVLRVTLGHVFLRYRGLIRSGFLVGLCVIVFAFVFTYQGRLFRTKWNPLFLWCYVFFTVYIMIFPFVLAYQLEDYLSDRVGYQVDMAAGMLTILCTLYTAEWCKARRADRAGEDMAGRGLQRGLRLCGVGVLLLNLLLNKWSDSMIPNQITEVATGRCAAFCEEVNAIYEEVAASEEKDVVITRELPTSRVMKMLDVRDWQDYWGNNGIAAWYGQDSLVFEGADVVYTDKLIGIWEE